MENEKWEKSVSYSILSGFFGAIIEIQLPKKTFSTMPSVAAFVPLAPTPVTGAKGPVLTGWPRIGYPTDWRTRRKPKP
jgi:hypothetical protein